MSRAPSVWVHVTTLMEWTRPPVGIIRVEQEYCRWLLARARPGDTPVIRFCVFERAQGRFVEVDAEQVAAKLRHSGRGHGGALPLRARIKHVVRQLVPHLPPAAGAWLNVWGRRLLQGALRAAHLPSRLLARQRPGNGDIFQPGDHWVSLGLDWIYLDQPLFARLRERHGLRTTVVCYDAIPVLFPELVSRASLGFENYLIAMSAYADTVLCISECTRRDFLEVLSRRGVPAPATQVIRLGADIQGPGDDLQQAPPALQDAAGARPFVLFVSTLEPRKNHKVLFQAWTGLRRRGLTPHRLVCVGMRTWGGAELLEMLDADPLLRDDVLVLNSVTDGQLAWLYRHCEFTVYPSIYEGWGLPVVESLAYGKLCLSSDAASLPEAGGRWAEYLDPHDAPAWEERLAFFMAEPAQLAERNERIAREFRAPAWSGTAESVHRVVLGPPAQSAATGTLFASTSR